MHSHSTLKNKTANRTLPQSSGPAVKAQLPSLSVGNTSDSPLQMQVEDILQLQRVLGNQAVLKMITGNSRALQTDKPKIQRDPTTLPTAVPVDPASPTAVPDDPSMASTPAASSRGENLPLMSGYKDIYNWLKERAEKDKKESLFGFFDSLGRRQKMKAIGIMAKTAWNPELFEFKSKMMSGIFRKSMNWDHFSDVIRNAAKMDTKSNIADQTRDYTSYAAIGGGGAASATGGAATISDGLGAGGASSVAEAVAPGAGGFGGLSALSQMYNATQDYDSSLTTEEKAKLLTAEAGAGAGDLTSSTANTVNSVRVVGGTAAKTLAGNAASVAAGIGGVVAGTGYLVGGVAGYRASRRNAANLKQMESRYAQNNEMSKHEEQMAAAIHLGRSTQKMNKSKSAATAGKGALMITGGAVLLAAAASPAGPIILAAAAILGGVAAVIKAYKKYKRKEEFVDRILNVENESKKPENEGLSKDKVRHKLLGMNGFNSVGQCYSQTINDLAQMLFDGGVKGDDEESQKVIENIGLKINKAKHKPEKELIAKKLHT